MQVWLALFAAGLEAINKGPSRFRDRDLKTNCSKWTKFIFGNEGDFSSDRFFIDSDCSVALMITDVFCAGDEFIVYDWNRRLGVVRPEYCPYDHQGVCGFCRRPLSDPEIAWNNPRFSSEKFVLRPGLHRITIKTLKSPVGAGCGFIKLVSMRKDHQRNQHNCGCSSEFTVLQSKSVYSGASGLCELQGMKLAQITKDTFDEVSQIIYKQLGPGAKAWIASYNGDTYSGNCLSFTVGQSLPSGNINIDQCSSMNGILCQK